MPSIGERRELAKLPADIVWGATAIARFLNTSEKRVYTLFKQGKLPVKKVGGQLVSTRGSLLRFIEEGLAAVEDADE